MLHKQKIQSIQKDAGALFPAGVFLEKSIKEKNARYKVLSKYLDELEAELERLDFEAGEDWEVMAEVLEEDIWELDDELTDLANEIEEMEEALSVINYSVKESYYHLKDAHKTYISILPRWQRNWLGR